MTMPYSSIAYSPNKFAALLVAVRQQKKQAFADMLRPYCVKLQGLARRLISPMLQPHVDADDLMQELELILWLGFSSGAYEVATPGQLLALAKTILRRCVSRQWRAVKRMNTTFEGKVDGTLADFLLPVSRAELDPGSAIDHADSVRHILDQLDAKDRRLVEMRLQGNSTAEVARQLGVAAGCLRVRLSRLRVRLGAPPCFRKPDLVHKSPLSKSFDAFFSSTTHCGK
jgi:eukaryotic-like serine/threonine-protein kinase